MGTWQRGHLGVCTWRVLTSEGEGAVKVTPRLGPIRGQAERDAGEEE